jgi:superfamily II DNA or RNA helicase
MFKVGDIVKIIYDGSVGAIVEVKQSSYAVLVNGKMRDFFEGQFERLSDTIQETIYTVKEVNALLTARLIENPNISSLYSLNSAKIDYIPYQYRPGLKIIKSDSPRILIADGVGVGKTIEAGLILKELQARNDIKSVLVICPRPLITEKKWQNELKRFGEKFKHIDGKTLRYCLDECRLEDGEWPDEYKKCIIPYSLFDEALVNGSEGKKGAKKVSLSDLEIFPKFDLVIIDEAHHIKNPNTSAYKGVKLFCDNAESIVMLTATPIQLGNKDLFILLNLLRPELIFDYDSFLHMSEPNPYVNEAAKIIRSNHPDWQKNALNQLQKAGDTSWGLTRLRTNPVYQKSIKLLSEDTISVDDRVKLIGEVESLHTFNSIINRTRRRDIGNFTVRKPETLLVRFTPNQDELYSRLINAQQRILVALHGDRGIRFMMTTILRQAASCIYGLVPYIESILTKRFDELDIDDIYDDENISVYENIDNSTIHEEVSSIIDLASRVDHQDNKFEALLATIKDKQTMENNRVMVFSSFRHTLKYLGEKLSEAGLRIGIVHGGVSDEDRVVLRNRFKKDRSEYDALDVLLFSEVGCEGLDYQFCDCMINYDLPWNPQRIEQRIGRIDRNGQKSESVSIINIITEGTIDFDIYDRCLSRIGVFNSSIGDSEEILGDITKEIYNIVENYNLTTEERQEKLQQLNDNKIRLIQEQQKLEDEKHTFFGLDMSENAMKQELEKATNKHLSQESIERLVETYLEKKLGGTSYIIGNGMQKTLRLNEDNRFTLLKAFNTIPYQSNEIYKEWKTYLNGDEPLLKITFNGQYASENKNVAFIMPTHPLVKQALNCFSAEPVQCALKIKTDKIPKGIYPFAIYEWLYSGVRRDNLLQVVTENGFDSKTFLELIYDAENLEMDEPIRHADLEKIHKSMWQKAKDEYRMEAEQIIGYKIENLKYSNGAREDILLKRIASEKNSKIITMKKAELANLQQQSKEKIDRLTQSINNSDIITKKLVHGILEVRE